MVPKKYTAACRDIFLMRCPNSPACPGAGAAASCGDSGMCCATLMVLQAAESMPVLPGLTSPATFGSENLFSNHFALRQIEARAPCKMLSHLMWSPALQAHNCLPCARKFAAIRDAHCASYLRPRCETGVKGSIRRTELSGGSPGIRRREAGTVQQKCTATKSL